MNDLFDLLSNWLSLRPTWETLAIALILSAILGVMLGVVIRTLS